MKYFGFNVKEHLLDKMRKYVKGMKIERSYSIQELIRESVEKYLKDKEETNG